MSHGSASIALVTGAGRGLGAAVAARLVAHGFRVGVSDVEVDRAEAVADRLGEAAVALHLDVTRKADFEAARDNLTERWGGVGVLVNNAALTQTTPIFDIGADEFDTVMAVNLRGTFFGCQVFGADFRDQGYGHIINMSSLAAQNGGAATGAHYAASKGAVATLTKVFARDLAAHGVTVNAIAPGPLDVELVREILPPEKLDAVKSMIPVGHLGDPDFIGDLVAFLASPGAASMTGATVDANGGLYAR